MRSVFSYHLDNRFFMTFFWEKEQMNRKMWKNAGILILLTVFLTSCGMSKRLVSDVEKTYQENQSEETEKTDTNTRENDIRTIDNSVQLRFEDGKLVDPDGETVQLRGVSTHGIAWFPRFVNANAFQFVKEAGGNVIRLAMYTQGDGCYLAEPKKNLDILYQGIESAKAIGLYVIVDWHILDDGNPNDHQKEAITFFDEVASHYGDDPAIFYEICNEPNGASWEEVSNYAYAIVPVIRQYAPNAPIIVGTPGFSHELADVIAQPLAEENIAYAYHQYSGEHYGYKDLKAAVEAKLPVFVSEWGVGAKSSYDDALKVGENFVSYLDENSISWCAWSFCDKDEVYSMLQPNLDKYGGYEESDLTSFGQMVFRNLGGTR